MSADGIPEVPGIRGAKNAGLVAEEGAWGQISQAIVHWTPLRGLFGFCRKKHLTCTICFYLILQERI